MIRKCLGGKYIELHRNSVDTVLGGTGSVTGKEDYDDTGDKIAD